jgi:hypothetical protein
LAPRKKVSSIVQHLNTKWGRSSCAKGDLMLFPYSARLDSIADSEKWTLKDSCTAGDVYVAVGSPSTFRLRFNFLPRNGYFQSDFAPIYKCVLSYDHSFVFINIHKIHHNDGSVLEIVKSNSIL